MAHNFPTKTGTTRAGARYGPAHQRARKAAALKHHPSDPCTRCHKPLGQMSPHLHYDHAEHGGYLGFAHATCNRKAGQRKGAHIANSKRQPRAHSRTW